ncbi:hypothetical protein EXS65_01755 [Candidatus Peribacteria bacterium]|nr:hypothetical protein [Candidatus Peribacteria bacterium]
MKNTVQPLVFILLVAIAVSSSAVSLRSSPSSSSRPVFRFPDREASAQSSAVAQSTTSLPSIKRALTKDQIQQSAKRKKQHEDLLKKLKAILDRAKKYQSSQSSQVRAP